MYKEVNPETTQARIDALLKPKQSGVFFSYQDRTQLPDTIVALPLSGISLPLRGEISQITIDFSRYTIVDAPNKGTAEVLFLKKTGGIGPEEIAIKPLRSPRLLLESRDFSVALIDKLAEQAQLRDRDFLFPYEKLSAYLSSFEYYGVSSETIRQKFESLYYAQLEKRFPGFNIQMLNDPLFRNNRFQLIDAAKAALADFAKDNIGKGIIEAANLSEESFFSEDFFLKHLHDNGVNNVPLSYGFLVEQTTGEIYFVMQKWQGVNLEDDMQQRQYSYDKRVEIFRTVAQTIDRAHKLKLIHGDIKLSNLLQSTAGETCVIDWNLSKINDPVTNQTLHGHGTPPYAAPELTQGGTPSVAADIYALGVLLYKLLVNDPSDNNIPYEDPDPKLVPPAVLDLIRRMTYPYPRERLRDLGSVQVVLDKLTEAGLFK